MLSAFSHEASYYIVSSFVGSKIAQAGSIPGVPQLVPDINLPGDIGSEPEIGQVIGEVLSGLKT